MNQKTTYTKYTVSGEGLRKERKSESKARALLENLVLSGYEFMYLHEVIRSRDDNSVISIKCLETVRPFYG